MGTELVEAFLTAIARTHAVGLMNQFPTDDLPEGYFEAVGAVSLHLKHGSMVFSTHILPTTAQRSRRIPVVPPRFQDYLFKACDEL